MKHKPRDLAKHSTATGHSKLRHEHWQCVALSGVLLYKPTLIRASVSEAFDNLMNTEWGKSRSCKGSSRVSNESLVVYGCKKQSSVSEM